MFYTLQMIVMQSSMTLLLKLLVLLIANRFALCLLPAKEPMTSILQLTNRALVLLGLLQKEESLLLCLEQLQNFISITLNSLKKYGSI